MRSDLDSNKGRGLDVRDMQFGVQRIVLAGDYTISSPGSFFYFLDPGASNRTITLPTFKRGLVHGIIHAGAASDLIVKDASGTTIATFEVTDGGLFVCSGQEWRVMSWSPSILLDTTEISSPDSSLTVTVVGTAVQVVVNETNVDHNSLQNFVADKHVAHTSVSISAGAGLSGGGDISASRSLALDLNSLAAVTPELADELAIYDTSLLLHKKITGSTLNAILDHNALVNYSANRHIDHTGVSISAGEGLTGGGAIDASRTISLGFHGLVADTPASGSEFAFWDAVIGEHNKITHADLITSMNATIAPVFANVTSKPTTLSGYGITDGQPLDAQLTDVAGLTPTDNGVIIGNGANFVVESGATLKTSLGLTIGVDVQAYDAELAALAGLVSVADKVPYFTGSGTAALADFPATMRTFLTTPSSANLAALLSDETGSGTAVFSSAIREKLAAARTYYVRTDGSDSNTGLANTAGGAFLTIQKAVDVILGTLDLAGFNVTIQVGNGTYTTPIVLTSPQVGAGTITISGDTTTPSNVVISTTNAACLSVSGYGTKLSIQGVKLQTTTSGNGITVTTGGFVTISGNIEYGACVTHQNQIDFGGILKVVIVSYIISGGSNTHWYIGAGGLVWAQAITWTLSGTPAFAQAFVLAAGGQLYGINYTVASGSATGTRYSVTMNGVVNTNGGGATAFPGNAAGATATGGQYA